MVKYIFEVQLKLLTPPKIPNFKVEGVKVGKTFHFTMFVVKSTFEQVLKEKSFYFCIPKAQQKKVQNPPFFQVKVKQNEVFSNPLKEYRQLAWFIFKRGWDLDQSEV